MEIIKLFHGYFPHFPFTHASNILRNAKIFISSIVLTIAPSNRTFHYYFVLFSVHEPSEIPNRDQS